MKNLISKMKNCFGNMPVQRKLLVSSVGLTLFPTIVLTVVFYLYAQNIIIQNERMFTENTLTQMTNNLNGQMERVKNVLYEISIDDDIQNTIEKLQKSEYSQDERNYLKKEIIDRIIRYNSQIKEIYEIRLILNDSEEVIVKSDIRRYANEIPLEQIEVQKGANVWGSVLENEVIPVYKMINSLSSMKPIGFLCAYIEKDYFYRILNDCENEGFGRYHLVDDQNRSLEDGQLIAAEKNTEKEYINKLEHGNWSLLCIQNLYQKSTDLILIQRLAVGLFIGLSILLSRISLLLSKTISKPIVELEESMRECSKGNFKVSVTAKYNDEIGKLRRRFNKMTVDTHDLLERIRMEEKLKQEAQVKALQMQINPHFFYNTIDTIHWLAQLHGEEDISNVAQAFGKLMRFSLDKNELIPFEKELDAIGNYMTIQSYRYGESLILDERIEEDVLYEFVPKHLLMPLIENAVEHGFYGKEDKKQIILSGEIKDERIILEVFDNGCGMDNSRIQEVLNEQPTAKGKHMSIGLSNVKKRLQLLYGEKASLQICSKVSEGTTVTITLPVFEDNMED